MANKNTTSNNYSLVKATAFWGIIISGIAGIITLIIKLLIKLDLEALSGAVKTMDSIASIMNLIASVALFISAFLAAFEHSKGKGKALRILFLVFAVIALLAILGFNVLNMF